jgi:hypothetical protein
MLKNRCEKLPCMYMYVNNCHGLKNGEFHVNSAKFFRNRSPIDTLPALRVSRKKNCTIKTPIFIISKYLITGGKSENPPNPLL